MNILKDYDLCQIQLERCKSITSLFLDTKYMSIRKCAENMMISKTTVWLYIHKIIRYEYPDDYTCIVNKLKYNKKYLGKPRRYW